MADDRVERQTRAGAVRRADIEPYTALRWVSTLFKAAAAFFAVALFTEFIVGFQVDGRAALPELLGELARTVVVAVVLWGAGDLVRLLIHLGHDIRTQRILLSRLAHRTPVIPFAQADKVPEAHVVTGPWNPSRRRRVEDQTPSRPAELRVEPGGAGARGGAERDERNRTRSERGWSRPRPAEYRAGADRQTRTGPAGNESRGPGGQPDDAA